MTYKELYEKATWLLEHNEINGKEYDKMIEPLNAEVGNAEPVRHGKWIRDEFGTRCGVCGLYAYRDKFDRPWESPYCPHCGAKMDGERKSE